MQLQFHPLAEIFPLLDGAEFDALTADIKEHGLREPITLHEGMILDGRNRYRACEAIGIETQCKSFNGGDPAAYVFSANIHRRHLTIKQKKEAIAMLLKANPEVSDRQIAAMAKDEHKKVGRVRADMEANGALPHKTDRVEVTGRKARGRKPTGHTETPESKPEPSGYRIKVPEGYSCLSQAIAAAVEMEKKGTPRREVLKKIKLGAQTYTIGRDVVLLSKVSDLSTTDASLVQKALRDLDDNRRVNQANSLIKPVAVKIWGHKGNRFKSDKSRTTAFCHSISFVLTTCNAATEMQIPHLDHTQRDEVLSSVDEAIASLRKLHNRLKGEHT